MLSGVPFALMEKHNH